MNKLVMGLCIFLTVYSGATFAGNKKISAIQAQVLSIDSHIAQAKSHKVEVQGLSLEGGNIVYFTKNGLIQKILANIYGEGGNTVETYYFDRDLLSFVEIITSRYKMPSGAVDKVEKQSYYFEGGKLLMMKPLNDAAKEAEVLDNAKLYRSIYKLGAACVEYDQNNARLSACATEKH